MLPITKMMYVLWVTEFDNAIYAAFYMKLCYITIKPNVQEILKHQVYNNTNKTILHKSKITLKWKLPFIHYKFIVTVTNYNKNLRTITFLPVKGKTEKCNTLQHIKIPYGKSPCLPLTALWSALFSLVKRALEGGVNMATE